MSTTDTFRELTEIIEQRKDAKPETSYVASLCESGLEKIIAKIGEETNETVAAAREDDMQHLVHEVADLWFHCMVLLAHKGTNAEAVLVELSNRFGTSGLVEKAQRNNTN